jgi:hypothetical protein
MSSRSQQIVSVKVVDDGRPGLFQRIITQPFKYYFRAGGFTFGLVIVSNLITSFLDPNLHSIITNHPQIYFTGLMLKSLFFGFVWPAFYITAAIKPKSAFIYGGGWWNK